MTEDWVSVKERLPEDGADVLVVYTDSHKVRWLEIAYYDEDVSGWRTENADLFRVSHWMSLPSVLPPEEEV